MKISCLMILAADRRKAALFLKASLMLQVSLLFLWGCDSSSYEQFSGRTMGTTYHITANLANRQSKVALQQAVNSRLEKIDISLSTYRPDSVISRFNQSATHAPLEIDHDFIAIMDVSRLVYQQSGGAFDPTVGALVKLWGFGPKMSLDQMVRTPEASAVAMAKSRMGFMQIEQKDNLIWKKSPVELDFSGVATGYAVDQVADTLLAYGISDYMVEIGGEIASRGKSPRGTPWRIGIEMPLEAKGNIQEALELNEAYITTAGDYRSYYEIDGKRYSHTIDPRTGYPVDHRLSSVTVAASSAAEADAWDTALMVLGEDEGYQLAEKLGLAAYFIYRKESGFDVRYTESMRQYFGHRSQ